MTATYFRSFSLLSLLWSVFRLMPRISAARVLFCRVFIFAKSMTYEFVPISGVTRNGAPGRPLRRDGARERYWAGLAGGGAGNITTGPSGTLPGGRASGAGSPAGPRWRTSR